MSEWKLVPVNPTAGMIDAAYETVLTQGELLSREAYHAMLAAAPVPTAADCTSVCDAYAAENQQFSDEITRLRAEVDALKRTHDEAMKRSHEVTQEMARQFETEVEALRADVVSRESEIASALQIVRVYAARNPLHDYNGVMQDPHGAHAWLARNDAARAAQGERG